MVIDYTKFGNNAKLQTTQIKDKSTIFEIKKLQIPAIWKISKLKEFLSQFVAKKFGFEEKTDLRLWKLDPELTADVIKERFPDSVVFKKFKIKGTILNDYFDEKQTQTVLKNRYFLFIEIKFSGDPKWAFNSSSL
jgi:hypothetical protein